jgi:hypothetical protein
MKKQINPPPTKTVVHSDDAMLAINEALVLGSLRPHQLTREAVALNARLSGHPLDQFIGINVSMDALSKGDPSAFPHKIAETQQIESHQGQGTIVLAEFSKPLP